MRFRNRVDAGQQLADILDYYKDRALVVYALPRGGVVLGAVIARQLSAPLDLIIPRKIGHPYRPEYAIAAVTEDGTVLGSRSELTSVDPAWLKAEIIRQHKEARRRRIMYSQGRPSYSSSNKVAIIVDDGIATGFTIRTAVHEIRKQDPAKIIVAVPVAPKEIIETLRDEVDDVVSLITPEDFAGSVGAYYDDFDEVEDDEVIRLLSYDRPSSTGVSSRVQ